MLLPIVQQEYLRSGDEECLTSPQLYININRSDSYWVVFAVYGILCPFQRFKGRLDTGIAGILMTGIVGRRAGGKSILHFS